MIRYKIFILYILNLLTFTSCEINREPPNWKVDTYEISLDGDLAEFHGGITVYAFKPQSYIICKDSVEMSGDNLVLSLHSFLPKYTLFFHYKEESRNKNITFKCCALSIDESKEYTLNGKVKRLDEQNHVKDSVEFTIKSFYPSNLPNDKQEYSFSTEI